MLSLLCRVLDADNDDFRGRGVHRVVDQIGETPRYQSADALGLLEPTDVWKQDEVLQAIVDVGADTLRHRRIACVKIIGNVGNIFECARREPS